MKRILLIDDDELLRRMLRIALRHCGYEVAEAGDGRQGLKLHRSAPADLVVTDLIMPEQEGLETIQEFRRHHPTVKIIAMSGGGRFCARGVLPAAKFLGADRTFEKPFANQDLLAAIRELLAQTPSDAQPSGNKCTAVGKPCGAEVRLRR